MIRHSNISVIVSRRQKPPSGLVYVIATSIILLSSSSSKFGSTTLAFTANDHYRSLRFTRRQPSSQSFTTCTTRTALDMSSIGGGNMDNNDNNDDDNPLNAWISRKDSDNVRRAREQFAEGRLPISYGAMNADNNEDSNSKQKKQTKKKNGSSFGPLENGNDNSTNDAIDATSTSADVTGGSNLSRTKPNPYLTVVSRLTPSDLISRFTSTASPRVQDAVRTTVLGLIGGLPQMAFETKTIATGERLASLMFQLQMTGYMFKNAEYRLSLSQSLGSRDRMLPGDVMGDMQAVKEGKGKLKGKIKVQYGGVAGGGSTSSSASDNDEASSSNETVEEDKPKDESMFSSTPGMEVEVDAQAYMSELRGEVSKLREELDATKQAKEEEIRKDLLMYIRTLPQQELQQLTGTMSPEVLEAMKGLVTAVLAGIGDGEDGGEDMIGNAIVEGNVNKIGPNTVTEQSGEALAQLCMWQLVVGFNLRELEVREEFRASMKNMLGEGSVGDGGLSDGGGDEDGGVQFGPGALE